MNKYENIKNLIAKGDDPWLKQSMELLKECFINLECDPDPIYLLEYRFNKNLQLHNLGVVKHEDYSLENNKIVKALLEFVNQLRTEDNFEKIRPLSIETRRRLINKKSIFLELIIFNEIHEIMIKTNWTHTYVVHNGKKVYNHFNILNYGMETHTFSINMFAKNRSELKATFSTAYDVWTAAFERPELIINEKSILQK